MCAGIHLSNLTCFTVVYLKMNKMIDLHAPVHCCSCINWCITNCFNFLVILISLHSLKKKLSFIPLIRGPWCSYIGTYHLGINWCPGLSCCAESDNSWFWNKGRYHAHYSGCWIGCEYFVSLVTFSWLFYTRTIWKPKFNNCNNNNNNHDGNMIMMMWWYYSSALALELANTITTPC